MGKPDVRNGSSDAQRVDADGDVEMTIDDTVLVDKLSRVPLSRETTAPRQSSRPRPRPTQRIQSPPTTNQDTTVDQYGLAISPIQSSKNQRTALDEQEYDPDHVVRPPRPSKPVRNDSRRGDEESTRQRKAGKDAANEVVRAPRSLWVCDRCFKYMPMESAYVSHIVSLQEIGTKPKIASN